MKLLFSSLLALVFFSQMAIGQTEAPAPKKEKRIEIVTKTIDENGEEKVTKIVREGDEVSDEEIDRLMKEHMGEEMSIDVEVTAGEDGTDDIRIIRKGGGEKHIRIVEQGVEVEEGSPERVMIFKSDDDTVTEMKGDEVIVIKKKKSGEEEIHIENGAGGEHQNIWIEEDGAQAGDVIIIEEEVTEEINKDGTVTKKTVKKKTVKKSNQ